MTPSLPRLAACVPVAAISELIRGDVFYWGALMAATLIPAIPLALLIIKRRRGSTTRLADASQG